MRQSHWKMCVCQSEWYLQMPPILPEKLFKEHGRLLPEEETPYLQMETIYLDPDHYFKRMNKDIPSE